MLTAGTRLGPYEVIGSLGAGGMGEVYRARDTTLNREVAIKVLPDGVIGDHERLARFRREAESLAALNHPNIAQIFGLEGDGGPRAGKDPRPPAIVMELVEGPTLDDRIGAGPIPFDEALAIATQIADALEAAHERGIVHRDLKPANIKVTAEGTVKVLDFGLAKAVAPEGSGSDVSNSPTLTAHAPFGVGSGRSEYGRGATQMGTIIGTAAYMAPEQARGKAVDRRADIWAFGVVLYEMLTGQRAFPGETVSDILAAVIKEQPDFGALPPVPERVRVLLERMLQKDPKLRLRDIGDARLELDAARHEPVRRPAAEAAGVSWLAAAAAGAVLLLAGMGLGWLLGGTDPPPERRVLLAADSIATAGDALALSPDGLVIAELSPDRGIRVRAMHDANWRLLPDTGGGFALTFDDTGRSIYFARGPEVLSLGVDGSSPISVASFGAGTQVLSLFRGLDGAVQAATFTPPKQAAVTRIAANGATEELWSGQIPEQITAGLLVTTQLGPDRWIGWLGNQNGSLGLAVVATGQAELTPILPGYRHAQHLGNGDVLAVDDRGRLTELHVDASSGDVTTTPIVRLEGVALVGGLFPAFDLSVDGTLAYVAGAVSDVGETLAWIDAAGNQTPATARTGGHDTDSRLAPDGRSLALEVIATESSPVTVWIHDLARDVRAALTPGIRATFPVWSPDSRQVALRLGTGIEPEGIYVVPADRSAPPRLLLAEEDGTYLLPMDWSADGSTLLYVRSATLARTADPANALWTVPLAGGEPQPFLETPASEVDGRYSPDGHWVAYASDQSGQYEIYLRPAAGSGEIRVSAEGGTDPEWNPGGGELFFLRGGQLLAVTVGSVDSRQVSAERVVLELPARARPRWLLPGPDGRFIIAAFGGDAAANTLNAIFNWRRGER